jgi:hypothetical protein
MRVRMSSVRTCKSTLITYVYIKTFSLLQYKVTRLLGRVLFLVIMGRMSLPLYSVKLNYRMLHIYACSDL